MLTCTFFGHRECPEAIQPMLQEVLEDLIVSQGVDLFYVGNQGRFDVCVRNVLRDLAEKYPHIRYAVVLAYLPGHVSEYEDMSETMLPEGQELVHPRYAITRRNAWMLGQADLVVAYVTHTWGGAARFVQKAEKLGKQVIYIKLERAYEDLQALAPAD